MRAITFRAWDKKTNQMYSVIEMGWRDGFGVRIGYLENHSWGSRPRELNEVELMQFTGLKDKNGKEIYEGDIVQDSSIYRAPFWQYKIAWNDSKAGWLAFPLDDANYGFGLSMEGAKTLEVIGNIYENHKTSQKSGSGGLNNK